jgi:3-hydroxyisobutyrate dehydrogenase
MFMKIAVLGTGLMGSAVAEAVLNAGHETIVYNRTAAKTLPLVALGAKAVATPAEAIKAADVSILVLLDGASVREVLLSDTTRAALKCKKVLNASTTSPDDIIAIGKEVSKYGGSLAEMSIMVGPNEMRGKQGYFYLGCAAVEEDSWTELLISFGKSLIRIGEVGDASKAEAPVVFASIFGIVTAAYAASVALKLNLPKEITDSYASMIGPAGEYLIPKMIAREYDECLASTSSLIGVADAASGTAKSLGFPVKVFEDMRSLFEEAAKRGYGAKDGSSIVEVLLDSQQNNH